MTFDKELESLLNAHSQENASNTPDFILAQYLLGCLSVWNAAVTRREDWYGRTTHVLSHWNDGPVPVAPPAAGLPPPRPQDEPEEHDKKVSRE